ncbi:MAG: hypothetical protein KAT28_05750 [Candidatus Aenigmarchaeota archaeon]|nr:hypothetical protein [Candidatus Aenigmarchaeota archaeon]
MLWDIAIYLINLLREKEVKKIPRGQFIKKIEKRYKMKLSNENKGTLLSELKREGVIREVTSSSGKRWVLLGKII